MKVSIVVPVYNMEKKLKKCLDTLVNQTYEDLEIIVVNDGSKDGSLDIIRKYEQKDSRIEVIDQKNQGISAARNNAMKKATGKLLCFVDSDDYVELNMVEELVDKMNESKADIVVCNYFIFNDFGDKVIKEIGHDELFGGSLYEHPQLIRKIDYAPWNKIYKRELFKDIEFPLNTKYEDFDAILKVFSKAKRIVKSDKPLYDYYINPEGETRSNSPKNMHMLQIANNLNNYFDFKGSEAVLEESFFETISEKLLNSAFSIIKVCNTRTCLKYINDVYNFLDNNYCAWKKLYMRNEFDSDYIKFIRGHKIIFKSYAFVRSIMFKITSK